MGSPEDFGCLTTKKSKIALMLVEVEAFFHLQSPSDQWLTVNMIGPDLCMSQCEVCMQNRRF